MNCEMAKNIDMLLNDLEFVILLLTFVIFYSNYFVLFVVQLFKDIRKHANRYRKTYRNGNESRLKFSLDMF